MAERPTTHGTELGERETKPFGGKLSVPAPFGCVLDTTDFKAPRA
ncbi:hypothetical protein [Streptomyces pseudogriseolus]|nr:hypothetical protein [Streptomyces pseudogriseolus]